MKRSPLALSGFVVTLIVGSMLILSQKTLLAQQGAETGKLVTNNDSNVLKKNKNKGKKHLNKENKSLGLAGGKRVGVKEIVKTEKKEKEEVGEKLEPKNDK